MGPGTPKNQTDQTVTTQPVIPNIDPGMLLATYLAGLGNTVNPYYQGLIAPVTLPQPQTVQASPSQAASTLLRYNQLLAPQVESSYLASLMASKQTPYNYLTGYLARPGRFFQQYIGGV